MQRWHCIRYHSLRGISVRGERQTDRASPLPAARCLLLLAVSGCAALRCTLDWISLSQLVCLLCVIHYE